MTIRNSGSRRPHGDGTVFYDKTAQRWVGRIELDRDNGKRKRVKVTADTEREAATKLRELRKRHDAGEDIAGQSMTLSQLLTKWLSDVAPNRQSDKSLEVTERLVKGRLVPALGHHKVAQLRPEHVEDFLRAEAAKGAARSTLIKLRSHLVQSLGWAEKRRVISWNPARLAELPPVSTTKPPRDVRALNADEARALLAAAADHRLHAWFALAITCGMRPGELCGLEWSAVDFDAGHVTVRQAMKWTKNGPQLGPTKTGKVRTLALAPELVTMLQAHRRAQVIERNMHGGWPSDWAGLVFTTKHGTPVEPKNLRVATKALGKRAGLGSDVTPYSLRHSACSILSAEGVPVELVADVLGHVDTRMAMRHYRHQVAPSVTAAVSMSSKLLKPTGTQP